MVNTTDTAAAARRAAAALLGSARTPRKIASARANALKGLAVIHAGNPTSRITAAIRAGRQPAPQQVDVCVTAHRHGPAVASRLRMRRVPTGLRWDYAGTAAGLSAARQLAAEVLAADASLTAAVLHDEAGRRCGYELPTPTAEHVEPAR